MNLTVAETATQLCQSQALAVGDIHPSPTNPRKTFPEAEQAEMVASVKRHGVMQPILVRPWPDAYAFEGERPKYELIAGERRWRAAVAAGAPFVPGMVRNLDDFETLELQIIENLHRQDLNELEEAEGYELMTKRYGYTAEQLAEKIDKSKAYIYARLKLTALCEKARQSFRGGLLDASRALLIARIPTGTLQLQALKEITEGFGGPMNYRNAAKHIQDKYMLRLAEAPFPRADADLLPAAGKCHPCPKRTGSHPELYPDVKSADICTDPECWAAKKAAHLTRLKEEAKAQGKSVIDGAEARKLMPGGYGIKGFLKLDERCYEAGYEQNKGYPTYRQLLADRNVPVTLVEKPDGSLVEAVEESTFKAIAADAGIKTQDSSRDLDKERMTKEKAENEFRQRLFVQIRAALKDHIEQQPELVHGDLVLIARQFIACTWHDNQKKLANLWIETEEKIDAHDHIRRLANSLENMAMQDLMRLLFDLALIGMTHVGSYQKTDTPPILLDTAKRLLISPDTLRREMRVKKEEKAAGKNGKSAKAPRPAAEPEQPAGAEAPPESTQPNAPKAKNTSGHKLATAPVDAPALPSADLSTPTKAARAAGKVVPAEKGKREVLYCHPVTPDLTWSGRGKPPRWVAFFLEKAGNTLEMLREAGEKKARKTTAKGKTGKGNIETDKTPIATEPPARCENPLELPGLAIETNENPTATETPAAPLPATADQ